MGGGEDNSRETVMSFFYLSAILLRVNYINGFSLLLIELIE